MSMPREGRRTDASRWRQRRGRPRPAPPSRGDSRLEDWRARGDDRHDRVRFRFIEALAQRAEAHEGEARRLLDARLAVLIEGYGADLEAAARGAKQAAGTVAAVAGEAGPADAAAPDTLAGTETGMRRSSVPASGMGPSGSRSFQELEKSVIRSALSPRRTKAAAIWCANSPTPVRCRRAGR